MIRELGPAQLLVITGNEGHRLYGRILDWANPDDRQWAAEWERDWGGPGPPPPTPYVPPPRPEPFATELDRALGYRRLLDPVPPRSPEPLRPADPRQLPLRFG